MQVLGWYRDYGLLNLESSARNVKEHRENIEQTTTRLDNNNIQTWDTTTITSETYQNIDVTINSFNRLSENCGRTMDTSFLTCLVGHLLIKFTKRQYKSSE